MTSKIGIGGIIRSHLATLVNERTQRRSWADLATFYLMPLLAGVALVILLPLRTAALQTTVGAFSIFSALLLNMLVIMFNLAKDPERHVYKRDQPRLIQQTQANIAYCILVGLVMVLVTLATLAVAATEGGILTTGHWISDAAAALIIYSGLVHFILSLVMVLKRVTVLLSLHAEAPKASDD